MTIEKVIKDGKVAVLYSPEYGAGWSSWGWSTWYGCDNRVVIEKMLFHPVLVNKVLEGEKCSINEELMCELFGKDIGESINLGGVPQLEVAWVPIGSKFTISEYDGCESVRILDDNPLVFTA